MFTKNLRFSCEALTASLNKAWHRLVYRLLPTRAPLFLLTDQLRTWSAQKATQNKATGKAFSLTVSDIDFVTNLVRSAVKASSIKSTSVLADQLLFLSIGAIQVQAQTGSDNAWKSINQAILSSTQTKQEKHLLLASSVGLALLICFSTLIISNKMKHRIEDAPSTQFTIAPTSSHADPVTISLLELAYKKMKNGSCQLPQAAMLPEEQRTAYLMFINEGVIEVQNVEHLRQALGYVSCLYPQELMRPQLPNKI